VAAASRFRHATGAEAGTSQCSFVDALLMGRHRSATEVAALHRADSRTDAIVPECLVEVRILVPGGTSEWTETFMQRVESIEAHDSATAPAAPPRAIPIAWSAWEPANMTPSRPPEAESNSDAPATAAPTAEPDGG